MLELLHAQSLWMVEEGVTGLGAPKERPWLALCLLGIFMVWMLALAFL